MDEKIIFKGKIFSLSETNHLINIHIFGAVISVPKILWFDLLNDFRTIIKKEENKK